MSTPSKEDNQNKSRHDDSSRKTRQQKVRSNPNSKLLNAAWPKAPTVPTRRSQIKAVHQYKVEKPWKQYSNFGAESVIEDMEVDVDMDEESRKSGASSTAIPHMKGGLSQTHPIVNKPSCSKSTFTPVETNIANRKIIHATQSPKRRSTRASKLSDEDPQRSFSADAAEKNVVFEKMKIDRSKENQAIFIIIHVSKVELGSVKGHATSPVKVYADKFMVQMEDESTKKDLSFRVPCKQITSLDVSFDKKPFIIKFSTPEIQYNSGHGRKTKSSDIETVILHLGYEECVPVDVREDLKELFQVRLAELGLWPATPVAPEVSKAPVASEEVQSKPKTLVVESETNEEAMVKNTEKEIPKTPEKSSTMISVRKRTPQRSKSATERIKVGDSAKFPRRCNFEATESLEEKVKTFQHEAAHYQAAFAQQRMIIQSLEDDLDKGSKESEDQLVEMQNELDQVNQNLLSRNSEITSLNNDLKSGRNLIKALENRIDSMRSELSDQDRIIGEKNVAIRIRDDTIQQLRTNLRQYEHTEKRNGEGSSSFCTMEETRQNLMSMKVSKENLSLELGQTQLNLLQKNKDFDELNIRYNSLRNEVRLKDEQLLHLRSDVTRAQTELGGKNEQLRVLEEQISVSGSDNDNQVSMLRRELSSARSENDDISQELAEAKSRLDVENDKQSLPNNDWTIERGEITFQNGIIGSGAWGNVKKGKFRGTEVAVKQIHLLILSPHNRRLFEREMSIASRCRHPCLVQFIGATNDDGTPLFVMELLETDLRSLLSREGLDHQNCVQIGFDVIRALSYLHQSKPTPIIHRDISSSNVLLYSGNSRWRAKLSDYGAANFMRLAMTRHPGGFLYSAPEASTVDQTTKLDVYSYGVLFCEMCTRELPVPENRREQVESVTSAEQKTLIKNCLKRDIDKRLDSRSVLQVFEGWLTDMDNKKK